jgi:hypothetical protein
VNHDANILILLALVGAPLIYYWTQVARRKRQVVKFKLRRVAVYIVCVVVGIAVIPSHGYSTQDAAIFSIFVGTTVAFAFVRPPKADRRIPTKMRRAVIARDLKGEAFDPKLHDIDHIVPFSKGGDHSKENLRVMARSENRRRGARMPKFKDFL